MGAIKGDAVTPNFDSAPLELARLPRWVLWRGKKIPYQVANPTKTASSTDPATWSSFDAAKEIFSPDRDRGVGFVLAAADGLACVDIDHSVSGSAINLLKSLNCTYIEYSPSGNGLHGWGYYDGDLSRKKGSFQGLSVEIYRDQRYITFTGSVIESRPFCSLVGIPDFCTHLQKSTEEAQKSTEENRGEQRMTEVIFSALQYSSVGEFLPKTEGQRNKRLFDFARYLKGVIPNAEKTEIRQLVQEWHQLALPVIGTKDFSTTWTDFLRGWEKVKFPHGETLAVILAGIEDDRAPESMLTLGYGSQTIQLAKICRRLAVHHGQEPFYISARQAGELIGVHFTDAAKMLAALVADDVLMLEQKGSGKVASRYRWRLAE